MDRSTRDKRARAKAQRTPRGQLSPFESKGNGRKGRIETFPQPQCTHITGGKLIWLHRERPDGSKYKIPITKGGHRCPKDAIRDGKCSEHLYVK